MIRRKKNEEKENKTEEDVAEGEASNPISEWEKKALAGAGVNPGAAEKSAQNLRYSKGGKITEEVTKKYWNSSAPIKVRISIDDKVYAAKEEIKATIDINNEASTTVKSLRLFLQEMSKKRKTIGGTIYVARKSFPASGPQKFNTTASIKLPSTVKEQSKKKKYELVLEVGIKFHNSLRVGVPVKVGTGGGKKDKKEKKDKKK